MKRNSRDRPGVPLSAKKRTPRSSSWRRARRGAANPRRPLAVSHGFLLLGRVGRDAVGSIEGDAGVRRPNRHVMDQTLHVSCSFCVPTPGRDFPGFGLADRESSRVEGAVPLVGVASSDQGSWVGDMMSPTSLRRTCSYLQDRRAISEASRLSSGDFDAGRRECLGRGRFRGRRSSGHLLSVHGSHRPPEWELMVDRELIPQMTKNVKCPMEEPDAAIRRLS